MAARFFARRRAITPMTASAVAATYFLLPKRTLHADQPPSEPIHPSRKPIYDDLSKIRNPTPSQKSSDPTPTSPTPTDRLASQIRRARLFLHAHVAVGEDRLNSLMSSLLQTEQSFTSTLASLAPPRESNERLLPGSIYVLVAAMTGSIISRNRNILLRATVPVAVGIGAGWVVLPLTMRNVGDLVWRWEERVPFVRENHLRIRGAAMAAWKAGRERAEQGRRWTDESVRKGREGMEEWVKRER